DPDIAVAFFHRRRAALERHPRHVDFTTDRLVQRAFPAGRPRRDRRRQARLVDDLEIARINAADQRALARPVERYVDRAAPHALIDVEKAQHGARIPGAEIERTPPLLDGIAGLDRRATFRR